RVAKFWLAPKNGQGPRNKGASPFETPPGTGTDFGRIWSARPAARRARPTRHDNLSRGYAMNFIVNLLILLPAQIASYFAWAGPLIMRLIVGYVFMLSGWGKLNNLPQITQNFVEWGVIFPKIMTPFVSGVEFFGGIMLILGLFTRIPAAMLAFTMLVAI